MEASATPQPTPGTFALGGTSGHQLALDGRGLARLSLMVGVVFDRMTAVDGDPRGDSAQR